MKRILTADNANEKVCSTFPVCKCNGKDAIAKLESEVASLAESSEWWRKACVRWQDWSTALLDEYGRQLRHGHHGSEPARRIIAELVGLAPGVPRCSRCGCFSTRHEVDDEELRNCLDCECTQYESLNPEASNGQPDRRA